MANTQLNVISPSESKRLKSLLKHPEKDLEEIISFLRTQVEKTTTRLKESEERYRSMIEQTTDAVFCYEFDPPIPINLPIEEQVKLLYTSVLVECNIVCAQSYGYKRVEDVLGHKLTDLFGTTSDSLDKLFTNLINSDYRIVDGLGIEKLPNGDERYFLNNGNGVIENGKLLRIWGTFRDITERRKAEQKLIESEEKFRTIADRSLMAISIMQDDVIKYANQRLADINGYSLEEIMNWQPKEFYKTVTTESLDLVSEQAKKKQLGLPGAIPHNTLQIIKKSGEKIWIDSYSKTINFNGKPAVLATFFDITDRKKVEQKLKDSEEKYRKIVETIPDLYFLVDQNGIHLDFKGSENLLYLTPDMFIGKTIHETLPEHVADKYDKAIKKTLQSREPNTIEYSLPINKRMYYYEARNLYFSENRVAIFVRDISKKKRAEQQLIESEQKFRTITEQSLMGICIAQDNKIKYINKAYSDIFGYTVEEMMNWEMKDALIAIHPDDRAFAIDQLTKKQRGERDVVVHYQYRGIKKSGEIIWVNQFSKSITYKEKPANLITLIDITKQKEVEEAFLTEKKFTDTALNAQRDTFFVFEPSTGKAIRWNNAFKEVSGYSDEEISKLKAPDAYYDDHDLKRAASSIEKIIKEGEALIELHLITKDGKKIPFEYIGSGVNDDEGNLMFIVSIGRDIRELKRTEKELKESEERYRSLIDGLSQTGIGIDIVDSNYNIIFQNQFLKDQFGEHQNRRCFEFYLGKEDCCEDCPMIKSIQNNKVEKVIITAPNNHTYEIISAPLPKLDGETEQAAEVIIDITDRIISEQKLRESEEKFRTIAEQSLIGIGIVQDDILKYVNKGLADIFGYSVEEMTNWPSLKFQITVHPENRDFVLEQVRKKQLGLDDYLRQYQFRGVKKTGEIIWIDNFTQSITYEGKPADLVTFVDITKTKKAEQELIKLDKMKTDLIRRTSHELKTPLVSIKGFSDLLLELHSDKLEDFVVDTITEIKQGCSRLETLIGDILKTAELEFGSVQLHKTEENLSFLIKLCITELRGFSELRKHVINLKLLDTWVGFFEKEQIHQVISNILSNAIKYTPPYGTIEIESKLTGDYIIVSIKDNGIGLTQAEQSSIFTQFGKIERFGLGYDIISEGSGLGLYISKKIVELHGGEIWVESKGRNRGSKFFFTLPIIKS